MGCPPRDPAEGDPSRSLCRLLLLPLTLLHLHPLPRLPPAHLDTRVPRAAREGEGNAYDPLAHVFKWITTVLTQGVDPPNLQVPEEDGKQDRQDLLDVGRHRHGERSSLLVRREACDVQPEGHESVDQDDENSRVGELV